MKLSDARTVINYLKIQTDRLAADIEEPLVTNEKGEPNPHMVEKLAKISCKLANHKLAVEMLEEYCEVWKGTHAGEPVNTDPDLLAPEDRPPSVSRSERYQSIELNERHPPPEEPPEEPPEDDILFDPWSPRSHRDD